MKIAYFDCFSGISGDMCLGALVDAGAPLEEMAKRLKCLPVKGYRLTEKKVFRAGVAATKVDVVLSSADASKHAAGKRWDDIGKAIRASSLSEDIKQKGLDIFRLLFDAESKVHGVPLKKIHLHELGAVDCLVDVFGTLIGLDLLGVKEVCSSAVNLGAGSVETAHGAMPVPAPATAEILKNVPVYSAGPSFELATPTGAAILKLLSRSFGDMPVFAPEKIGLGAGKGDFKRSPNILRIFIGDLRGEKTTEDVTVIETNIDDMNPQAYEYLYERLFAEGALDVSMTQTVMKKMRPGIKLSVLCSGAVRNDLILLILRETTSIGVRYYAASRVTMQRARRDVDTLHGKVRIKTSSFGEVEKSYPEYEDCKTIARRSGVPLLEVIDEAKRAAAGKTRKKK
jgi:uncharacterized protein (TIGR00299 family) protein